MLRAVALRLAPLICACALAGCGGGGPGDEQQVRATLGAFQRATAGNDYAALCERILAPHLVARVTRLGLRCEDALERGFAGLRAPQLSVGRVTVDGDRARAQVRTSAEDQAPSEDELELLRIDGRWRIASLAGR